VFIGFGGAVIFQAFRIIRMPDLIKTQDRLWPLIEF